MIFNSDYNSISDDYNQALEYINKPENHIDNATEDCNANSQYFNYKANLDKLLVEKNNAALLRVIGGSLGLGIWLWNVYDLKKSSQNNSASFHNKVFFRVTALAQIQFIFEID